MLNRAVSVYGGLENVSNWPSLVAVDTLAWPSAMHRSWKPPNEPHLHLKGAPITLAAFYFIDAERAAWLHTPVAISLELRYPTIFISSR